MIDIDNLIILINKKIREYEEEMEFLDAVYLDEDAQNSINICKEEIIKLRKELRNLIDAVQSVEDILNS